MLGRGSDVSEISYRLVLKIQQRQKIQETCEANFQTCHHPKTDVKAVSSALASCGNTAEGRGLDFLLARLPGLHLLLEGEFFGIISSRCAADLSILRLRQKFHDIIS